MIIIRKHQKEYSKPLLTTGKKRAIRLWIKDRFTDGLEGEERKLLERVSKRGKTKLSRHIFGPA